jgi:hypothetical protein
VGASRKGHLILIRYPTYPGSKRPFCGCTECNRDHYSIDCRTLWHTELRRRRNRQKRADSALFAELGNCPTCGKMFLRKQPNQQYCCPEQWATMFKSKRNISMSGKRQPTKNPYSGPTHHAKSKGKYQQEIKCPRCKKIRVEMVNYKPFRKEHIACGQCRIYFTNDGTV